MSRFQILFVCTGNICRSPTAEGMFRHKLALAGLEALIEADSCGVSSYHVGDPPDPRSIAAAERRGYDISNLRARNLRPRDFDDFTHLLAMDRGHLAAMQRALPVGCDAHVGLFLDFAPGRAGQEVPDPYYGGPDGFEHVLDLLDAGTAGLLDALQNQL